MEWQGEDGGRLDWPPPPPPDTPEIEYHVKLLDSKGRVLWSPESADPPAPTAPTQVMISSFGAEFRKLAPATSYTVYIKCRYTRKQEEEPAAEGADLPDFDWSADKAVLVRTAPKAGGPSARNLRARNISSRGMNLEWAVDDPKPQAELEVLPGYPDIYNFKLSKLQLQPKNVQQQQEPAAEGAGPQRPQRFLDGVVAMGQTAVGAVAGAVAGVVAGVAAVIGSQAPTDLNHEGTKKAFFVRDLIENTDYSFSVTVSAASSTWRSLEGAQNRCLFCSCFRLSTFDCLLL